MAYAEAPPQPLGRNRDFLLLMLGQAGSLVGSSMTTLALAMLAYAITESAALAGVVSAVYGVGLAAMMLPAGAIVDRVDRKKVMIVTATGGAVVLVSIPVAAAMWSVTFPHLIVVAGLGGALTCFYNPAEIAALKEVVPPVQMGTAMAANQGRGAIASLIGPPAAALLYGIGRTLPFLIDALTFAIAAVCTAMVRRPLPAPQRPRSQSLARDVVEGVGWLRRARPVRDLVVSTMVSNIAFTGAATTVLLALQQGGTPPSQLGLLQASYGLAGIAGSLLASAVLRRATVGAIVRSVFWLLAGFQLFLTLHASIWWLGLFVALGYLVVGPSNTAMSAYQVHVTPPTMLGRSEAAASFGRVVMIPIGSSFAGVLLEAVGRVPTTLVFAAVMGVAATIATFSRPLRSTPKTTELHTIDPLR
ncbi:MFS transporter [Actinopolymorpha pittospori]|uniref:MFS family permease n=2 Tax=Actinopolymorpha pittospori TaxID=648752 RepID=A0A927N0D5_9ACTN|nr:MFS transporter [Actinopolymorpha pittospori]MBE1609941.1 MFS family permease [Actinopolymorpha pittospori]